MGESYQSLEDALTLQPIDLLRRQTEPTRVDLFVVLAERRARLERRLDRTVQSDGTVREDDISELRMLDPLQHAALVKMRIIRDLVEIAHRRAGDAMLAHKNVNTKS